MATILVSLYTVHSQIHRHSHLAVKLVLVAFDAGAFF